MDQTALGPRRARGLAEDLFDISGLASRKVAAYPASVIVLARRPAAFVPLMMSFAALTVVVLTLVVFGVVREHDEGAAAHPISVAH